MTGIPNFLANLLKIITYSYTATLKMQEFETQSLQLEIHQNL